MKLRALAITALLATSCQTLEPPQEPIDRYKQEAMLLIAGVSNDESLATLGRLAESMRNLSEQILGDFAVIYPPCGAYLNAAMRVSEKLDVLSLEEIERDYHADGALPEAPDFCYHAKDLVVHPATVILLSREPDTPLTRGRINAEIQEVRAHIGQVERLLTDE